LIEPGITADVVGGSCYRLMSSSGEASGAARKAGLFEGGRISRLNFSSDVLLLNYHGHTTTHLDSLGHVAWEGKLYNGHPAEAVTAKDGATIGSVDLLKEGIVCRGVLLDVARTKGVKWLERGEGVYPEDLEETERRQSVKVGSGDALLLRTGAIRRRNEEGPANAMQLGQPGYHAASLPWLHRREVALITSDTSNDSGPSGYRSLFAPIHAVAHVAMGLWMLDNSDLEALAAACEQRQRWEFLYMVMPLRVAGGTGCPVNPIAVF
jgi:kynurenine formamidase